MEKTPRILTGPPGCGKSYWIQKYAQEVNKQLFVCPCRKDRTLRDGRQKLHVWARRTEPAILWLEGADDLTPEAQAFLRRMLETHAPEVQFILECRDAGRLQEPIRSRCILQTMGHPSWDELLTYAHTLASPTFPESVYEEIQEYLMEDELSYRRIQQCMTLYHYAPDEWRRLIEHRRREREACTALSSEQMLTYLREAYHPEHFIQSLLSEPQILKEYGKCLECSGSLWAFLGSALDTHSTTPTNQ
jgi:hypothetical protein